MKIALLVCDRVPEPLREKHGTYPDMYRSLFELPMDAFYVCEGDFPALDDYKAFICTGSRHSVYEESAWILELKQFTQRAYQAGKIFIGVCFGHQLIAESLGGKVERSDGGFLIGIHTFEIIRPKEWMKPLEREFNILMLCRDQVVKLPETGDMLAQSPYCPVGAFQMEEHFLGIQGHPEFTNEYNRALFELRLGKKDAEKKAYALRIFHEKKADRSRLAAALRNFLNH
ncbi:MAG: amidotransferase [Balneolaceae bacterium]